MRVKFTFSIASLVFLFTILVGFESNLTLGKNNFRNQKNLTEINQSSIFGAKLLNPLLVLSESFESTTFPPSGWIKISPANGTSWNKQNAGTTPVPGLNFGYIIAPAGGGTAVAFCNYLTGSNPPGHGLSNQWLITPKLGNIQPGDSISFWLRKIGNYFDHFQVMLSITTPTVGAMTIVVDTMTFYSSDSGYVFHKYNIGSLVPNGSNIYIGFREWVEDAAVQGATFSLDLVKSTAQVVEVSNINQIPDNYYLGQNYPNPFNPTTAINYSIARKGFVSLKVFDILGKEVATLVNEVKDAGTYSLNFNAAKLTSGVYFYRIQTDKFTDMKSMVLVK